MDVITSGVGIVSDFFVCSWDSLLLLGCLVQSLCKAFFFFFGDLLVFSYAVFGSTAGRPAVF